LIGIMANQFFDTNPLIPVHSRSKGSFSFSWLLLI
jgi:hypothetical protein